MRKQTNGVRSAVAIAGFMIPTWVAGCGGFVNQKDYMRFDQRLGKMSVTVFPAFVREWETSSYHQRAAGDIARALSDAAIAEVTVSDREVPITGSWHMSQTDMLRESAADLAAYIQENPIETEYAFMAEYLIGRGGIGGIQFYVVDDKGTATWARVWNSHHRAFVQANLKTPDDCAAFLSRELPKELAPAAPGD